MSVSATIFGSILVGWTLSFYNGGRSVNRNRGFRARVEVLGGTPVSKTLSQFAKSMRRRAALVETSGNYLAQAGARGFLKTTAELTPVDTSAAVSNWIVGNGAAVVTFIPPHVLGTKGSTRKQSTRQTIAEGNKQIELKRPGQALHITNSTPYIKRLDEGSSRQFAGGFVPAGILAFRLRVSEALKTLWTRKVSNG